MKTITINIDGMHCDGCAERIKTVLAHTHGVNEAAVSFAEGRARIRYNPQLIDDTGLVALIERAGFAAQSQA